jgi:hypothetical protein
MRNQLIARIEVAMTATLIRPEVAIQVHLGHACSRVPILLATDAPESVSASNANAMSEAD